MPMLRWRAAVALWAASSTGGEMVTGSLYRGPLRTVTAFCLVLVAMSATAMSTEEYRQAFGEKRYQEVIDHAPIVLTESPTAANWYRLGYAAAELEQWPRSKEALLRAKALDDKLTFVPDPADFTELLSRVEKRAPTAAAEAPATASSATVIAAIEPQASTSHASNMDLVPAFVLGAILGGAIVALVGWILMWMLRQQNLKHGLKAKSTFKRLIYFHSNRFDLAAIDFQQTCVDFESRLTGWGHSDSVLAWRLRALMSVLEAESGKKLSPASQAVQTQVSQEEGSAIRLEVMDPVLGHHDEAVLRERLNALALRHVLAQEGWACAMDLNAMAKTGRG